MDVSTQAAAARIRRFLANEAVVWLSTIRHDGLPHLVPCWFWFDGSDILVFSKPQAVKVRNMRSNPRVMLALGDPDADFDVGLLEAHAVVLDRPIAVPDGFHRKYADRMAAIGLDRATFERTYRQAVRIVPTRFLEWRGRSIGMTPGTASVPSFA